jgi:hypothetical protein
LKDVQKDWPNLLELARPVRDKGNLRSFNLNKICGTLRREMQHDIIDIRRIEQPVYKRRWDEQWKVGNR